MLKIVTLATFCACFTTLFANAGNAGFISNWQGSSGLLPNQIIDPWTFSSSASPEQPSLSGGVLQLDTSPAPETMFYIHQGSIVDTSSPFFIETRLKHVSGTSFDSTRATIGIGFTTTANVGNALFIGADEIFFGQTESTTTAKLNLDTNGDFHTYRIDYDGTGGLQLRYDGALVLTANTYTSAGAHGTEQRIYWGDVTGGAQGTSQYTFFTHNALTVTAAPEPVSVSLIGLAAVVMFRRGRSRVGPWPRALRVSENWILA